MLRTHQRIVCIICLFLMTTSSAQAQKLLHFELVRHLQDRNDRKAFARASECSSQEVADLRTQSLSGLSTLDAPPKPTREAPKPGLTDSQPLESTPAPESTAATNENSNNVPDPIAQELPAVADEAVGLTERMPGDLDADGDVDLDDYAAFSSCFAGPDSGLIHPGCEDSDINADGEVDLLDFSHLQRFFDGSSSGSLLAVAGGPYRSTAEDRTDGGWVFTFDGSLSTPGLSGDQIVSWVWDFGTNTFDGAALNLYKWNSIGAAQNDALVVVGHGSQWRNGAISRDELLRARGASVQAKLIPHQTGGYAAWGLKRLTGMSGESDFAHGFYFDGNGEIRITEDGQVGESVGAYVAGTAYELLIELKDGSGALYFMREAGASEWSLVEDSNEGSENEMTTSLVAYRGTFIMDDLRESPAGEIIDWKVYGDGDVVLRVENAGGANDTDMAFVQLVGDPLQANAGGPFILYAEDRDDLGWPVTFGTDSSSSTSEIVQARWDYGEDEFGGQWLNPEVWDSSRAVQHDVIELWGANDWSSFLSEAQAISRLDGVAVQATVVPWQTDGIGVLGFSEAEGHTIDDIVHGICFHYNGYIYYVEDGALLETPLAYSPGQEYDVRIELLAGAGARYYMRDGASVEWEHIADTGSTIGSDLHRTVIARGGLFTVDDWSKEFRSLSLDRTVYHDEIATLTVWDAVGRSSADEFTIATSPAEPIAGSGGPYLIPEALATPHGMPLDLDASESTSGAAIVHSTWDFGTDSLDGVRLDERKWTSTHAIQDDALILMASDDWGSAYACERNIVERTQGTTLEARVRSNGRAIIGFLDDSGGVGISNVQHGIYLALGEFRVVEQGAQVEDMGEYLPNEWYDVRITLTPDNGAAYWVRASESQSWSLLHVSSAGNADSLRRGVIAYSGTSEVDEWRDLRSGLTCDAVVYGDGEVELTVATTAGRTASSVAEYSVDGETPVADAGDAIELMDAEYVNNGWTVSLDGSGSSDDIGIVQYLWSPEVDTFDGLRIDDHRWRAYNTTQANKLTTEGATSGSWGSGYAFDSIPVQRGRNAHMQSRVAPNSGRAMWGFRNAAASGYSYTTLVHAVYFNADGLLNIYEDGTDRGVWGSYEYGVEYDLRIELKETGGARYLLRVAGDSRWTPLYESYYSSVEELQAGWTLYDGSICVDDFQRTAGGETIEYRVQDEGTIGLTVYDAAGQPSTDSTELYVSGVMPVAEAGGPYVAPIGSFLVADASASTAEVAVLSYEWDFGDGTLGAGQPAHHKYDAPGTYALTLTVTDTEGRRGTDTTTVDVEAMVVTAPWDFDPVSGIEVPHNIIDADPALLRAVLFTDTPLLDSDASEPQIFYTWDFGDGSDPQAGVVEDKRAIEATHTYSGTPGALYTATLTVHDPVYGDLVDVYPMQIHEQDLTIDVNIAIERGLWWLHKAQDESGRWASYGSYYAGSTASATHAMEINGHVPPRPVTTDPLIDDVIRGLEAGFGLLSTTTISLQNGHDPDSNSNGYGIGVSSNRPIYEGGMVMDAIAASGAPQMFSTNGSLGISGRSYRGILQDMVDMYAWGQASNGGWRYSWNSEADNSACQWAAIGFLGARVFGLDAPQWVKDENNRWLNASYNGTGFGYSGSGNGIATTPSGMVQLAFCGYEIDDSRWQTAEAYIANNWNWFKTQNNVYAWYAFMKAMRLAEPDPVVNLSATGLDWYGNESGLIRYVLSRQNADGGWPDYYGRQFATAWQTIILTPSYDRRPPSANAGSDITWACQVPLEFNACDSYHTDPVRVLVYYEWDFDGDGTYDYAGEDCAAEFTYNDCPAPDDTDVYVASLRVTDDVGQTDIDTRQVTIKVPPIAPIADANGPYIAYTGIPILLDGSGSYDIDPDDYITRQDWDLDGSDGYDFDNPDLAIDCPLGACPPAEWTFNSAGTINIGLRVWDSGILNPLGCVQEENCEPLASVVEDYTTVMVFSNHAPVADAGGPYEVDECETVTLDGSASYDADGNPLSFRWDLDGDGEFDDATSPAPSYEWAADGSYTVGLIVSDGGLDSDPVYASVIAYDTEPTMSLTGPPIMAVGQMGCFDSGVVSLCDNLVSVEWDWDYSAPAGFVASGDTTEQACHVYDEFGNYEVAVLVTDSDQDQTLSTMSVVVDPDQIPVRPASHSIEVIFERRGYLPATNQHYADVSLKNVGETDVRGPLMLAFDELSPPGTYVVDADGIIPETGLTYIDFSQQLVDAILAPGEQTGAVLIHWQIVGDSELFSFESVPYAANSTPQFVTSPATTATEGIPYRYQARAEDPEGDAIVYQLATAPDGMSVSTSTGLVKWTPGQMDEGVHSVLLLAVDGYTGGSASQAYEITVGAMNVAPVFVSTPTTVTQQDSHWCYDVEAMDPDGDEVSIELVSGPEEMGFEGDASLCWTSGGTGRYYVRLAVSDDTHVTTQDFYLTVIGCEDPPTITSTPPTVAAEGITYLYDVDADSPVVFSLSVAPDGMTIDGTTGVISWLPNQQQGGARVVKVVATDEDDPLCLDEQIFQVEVEQVNVGPVFETDARMTATEGEVYHYWSIAVDPDGDQVLYGLDYGPAGMTVDDDTGIVTWTPSQTSARDNDGVAEVSLIACDPSDACNSQMFSIDIEEINVAPAITSYPQYSAREGIEYIYQVVVTDADEDDIVLTLEAIPDDPDVAPMVIDSAGLIQWTPSQTAAQRNSHPIRIRATDGEYDAIQAYDLFVVSVNVPPTVEPLPDSTVDEGSLLQMQIVAVDPDGDQLSFMRSSEEPHGMSVHPVTGQVEWLVGCGDAGIYSPVVIEVSDGHANGISTVEFSITINEINCGPRITSTPVLEAAVGHEYIYEIDGIDPELYPISCALEEGPSGMVSDGCVLTWTPDVLADELVRVVVSDDEARDCTNPADWCQEFTIHVVPCLSPPKIVSVAPQTAAVSNEYRYEIGAHTGEPSAPQYEIVNGPAGMTVDPSGNVSWTPTAGQVGLHAGVTVGVYTGLNECRDEQSFDVEVIECTDPPAITSLPPTSVDEASEYTYVVEATAGQVGDDLTYELADAPDGMVIDAETGAISWAPLRADYGDHIVRIVVRADRLDCRAEQAYVLTVNTVEIPPEIVSDCPSTAYVDSTYYCQVEATDANGDDLSYSLITSTMEPPAGMAISQADGLLTWTPTLADVGTVRIGVRASEVDGSGYAETEFPLTVLVNTPPEIVSIAPLSAVAESAYMYDVDAIDADGHALILSLDVAPGGMEIDGTTGVITWTPSNSDVGAGVEVSVSVSDGHGGVDVQVFELTVHPAGTNVEPVITSVPTEQAAPECPYTYQVKVTDANGDAVACELLIAPAGMEIGTDDCLVSWTAVQEQLGDHDVQLRAYETGTTEGLYALQDTVVAVRESPAPAFTSTPVTVAVVGKQYRYDAVAEATEGGSVRYELLEGPTSMSISSEGGRVVWIPSESDIDPENPDFFYDVTIAAYDTRCGESTQSYRLYVGLDDEPPVIELDAPVAIYPAEQAFPITARATDNVAVASLEVTVNGQPVELDADGTVWFQSTGPGVFEIQATAIDTSGNAAIEHTRTIANDDQVESVEPIVQIISPADGSTITEPVDIIGTIQHENLAYWELSYRPAGNDDDEYVLLAESTVEVPEPDVLASFDPTKLMNGLYELRIYSIDLSGTYYEGKVSYLIDGNMKIGNFTVSYTDLSIPVAGLPIEVKRTYDSRNKANGDFGVGWTLDTTSVEVEEGTDLAEGWATQMIVFPLPAYIVTPTRSHMVNVKWPGGRNQPFAMMPPDRPIYVFEYLAGVDFTMTGVQGSSTLTTNLDEGRYQVYGDHLGAGPFSDSPGEEYDPSAYELTTAEGAKYSFAGEGRKAKLKSMSDTNGNRLDITRDGIIHSSGRSVTFERDEMDRITAIHNPNGNTITYAYDAEGNLKSQTDAEGNTVRFDYGREHLLTDITDPLGRRGVRNEYDDDGRLIAHIDANGNRIEYDRDIDARQEVITDRLQNTTVFYYDDRGNVVLKIDAEGAETEYEYDDRDNLLRETIVESETCPGREKTFTYDEDDHRLTETSCSGGVTSYVRNEHGNILDKTDPEGHVTQYTYDSEGNLLTEEAPDGGLTEHAYDSAGRRISTTNPLGFTEYFEFDEHGNQTAHVDFAGARTESTYDDNFNRLTETTYRTLPSGDVEAITTRFFYDGNNRLIKTIGAYGAETTTVYDAAGKRIASTDKLGHTTSYEYDMAGNLLRITYPDESEEVYGYDAEGHRTSSTNRNGHTTRFEFDKLGRMAKTFQPDDTPDDWTDNHFTETEYDCLGRTIVRYDERRNPVSYDYPDCTSQVVTDALSNATRHEFDLNNNRVRTVDALSHETQYSYDAMGRLVLTTYHDGTTAEIQYDLAGRKTVEIDQAGAATQYEHDPMGRLLSVSMHSGTQELVTSYTYDELGNQLTQTDAEGRTTQYEYDKLSRRVKRILPLGQEEVSTYNAGDRLESKTDFNGAIIEFSYDINGRTSQETWPDGTTIEFGYLPGGQRNLERTTTPNPGGDPIVTEVTKTYNERGKIASVSNPDGSLLEYGYDEAGNRTALSTVTSELGAQATTFQFDQLNRLWKVHDPNGGTTTYSYDNVGNRESVTLANGVVTSYEFDNLNRLTRMTNAGPDSSVISMYEYALGPAGNRMRVDETTPDGLSRVVEYQYDGLYRLVAEIIDEPEGTLQSDQAIAYTYDGVGNRLVKSVADMDGISTTTYDYDENDRLLTERTLADDLSGDPVTETEFKEYTYDDNGNTLTRSLYSAIDTYTYDLRNRLVAAQNRTETGSDVTFSYDADNIRIGKAVAEQYSTTYVVDKNRRYAQVLVDASGPQDGETETTLYVHGDDLLSMTRVDTGSSYYLYDGQMSTRQLTGALASVTDTYTYDAFGVDLDHEGTTPNVYKYTGEQYDINLGFYYLRARYYAQSMGRFLSMDSYEGGRFEPASLHKYMYAMSDAVNNSDPSGNSVVVGAARLWRMAVCMALLIKCAFIIVFFEFFFISLAILIATVGSIFVGPLQQLAAGLSDFVPDQLLGAMLAAIGGVLQMSVATALILEHVHLTVRHFALKATLGCVMNLGVTCGAAWVP